MTLIFDGRHARQEWAEKNDIGFVDLARSAAIIAIAFAWCWPGVVVEEASPTALWTHADFVRDAIEGGSHHSHPTERTSIHSATGKPTMSPATGTQRKALAICSASQSDDCLAMCDAISLSLPILFGSQLGKAGLIGR